MLDFKKWPARVVLAVFLTMVLFGAVYSVTPIYGLNITAQSATGSSNAGGSFGQLNPTLNYGYR
jgi:hypothetical protein